MSYGICRWNLIYGAILVKMYMYLSWSFVDLEFIVKGGKEFVFIKIWWFNFKRYLEVYLV